MIKSIDRNKIICYERLEAYKRKLAIIDYNTSIDMAHKEGREEGERAQKLRIAKNLKEKGIEINIIVETTGLTKEEVEKL